MRNLASIQRIKSISPVENSDSLSVAIVLGWRVVIRTGYFNVEDLVVFFEVDSVLQPLPEFEFLKKSDYRLKTVRLRGQLSQGLIWSTSIIPSGWEPYEGMDVTELLGVTKYEEELPENLIGISKGYHPTIVRKAGEFRVQSNLKLLDEFKGLKVAFGTKIEGETSSFIKNNNEIDVCSHTHSLLESNNSIHWQMYNKYNLKKCFSKTKNIAIQGEIAGIGIFGNPLGLDDKQLFIFRITDLETHKRYTPREIIKFCETHNLQHVFNESELDIEFNFTIDEVIELSKGTYEPSGYPREGIVIVPMELTYSEALCDWLSMKVINNEYLLGEWKQKRKGK